MSRLNSQKGPVYLLVTTIGLIIFLLSANTTDNLFSTLYPKPPSLALAAEPSPTPDISTGLVGYWKFDETSANTCIGGVNDSCDSSGLGNNGAWLGNATYTASGKFNGGINLDGSGDYVDFGNPASGIWNFGTSDYTLSAWAYVSLQAPNQIQTIIGKGRSGARGPVYVLYVNSWNTGNGALVQEIGDGVTGQALMTATGQITKGVWNHVAYTKSGNTSFLYINGVLKASGPLTVSVSSTYPLRVGLMGSNDFAMRGIVDEARVYNRHLSEAEIQAIYNFDPNATPAPTPTPTPTPSPTPTPITIQGDINGSGQVDYADFDIVVTNFNKNPATPQEGDINNNGQVDMFDFNLVHTNFGRTS